MGEPIKMGDDDINSLDDILQQLQDFGFSRPNLRTVNQRRYLLPEKPSKTSSLSENTKTVNQEKDDNTKDAHESLNLSFSTYSPLYPESIQDSSSTLLKDYGESKPVLDTGETNLNPAHVGTQNIEGEEKDKDKVEDGKENEKKVEEENEIEESLSLKAGDEDKNDSRFVSPESGTGRQNKALAKFKTSFQRNLSNLDTVPELESMEECSQVIRVPRSPEHFRIPEPRSPEPFRIPEPRSPKPIWISKPRFPEPIRISEPISPEPISIPEPRSPEPISIPEPRSPEPIRIPEPRSPGAKIRISEPKTPKIIRVSEPGSPGTTRITETRLSPVKDFVTELDEAECLKDLKVVLKDAFQTFNNRLQEIENRLENTRVKPPPPPTPPKPPAPPSLANISAPRKPPRNINNINPIADSNPLPTAGVMLQADLQAKILLRRNRASLKKKYENLQ